MTRCLVTLIRIYQNTLSPFMLPSCRFIPSCSDYAAQALQRRGLRAGLWLVAMRLLRCRPFGPQGYDPVHPHIRDRNRRQPGFLHGEFDNASKSSQPGFPGVRVS